MCQCCKSYWYCYTNSNPYCSQHCNAIAIVMLKLLSYKMLDQLYIYPAHCSFEIVLSSCKVRTHQTAWKYTFQSFIAHRERRTEFIQDSSNCKVTKCTNLPEISFLEPAFHTPVSFCIFAVCYLVFMLFFGTNILNIKP